MKAILTRLMADSYASLTEFPELATEAARKEIEAKALEWGARFSYDPRGKTVALLLPPRENAYSPTQRAALWFAYVTLRVQADAYRTVHQNEPITKITIEGQEAVRDAREFTIRAENLSASYPNVFPRPGDATNALRPLTERGFLEQAGGGAYKEGPLLGHAFDRNKAQYLLEGEMAGMFDELKPALSKTDEFDQRVLETIQQLKRGDARKEVLEARLKKPWRSVKAALDRLKKRRLIDSDSVGRGTFYFVPEVM